MPLGTKAYGYAQMGGPGFACSENAFDTSATLGVSH